MSALLIRPEYVHIGMKSRFIRCLLEHFQQLGLPLKIVHAHTCACVHVKTCTHTDTHFNGTICWFILYLKLSVHHYHLPPSIRHSEIVKLLIKVLHVISYITHFLKMAVVNLRLDDGFASFWCVIHLISHLMKCLHRQYARRGNSNNCNSSWPTGK